MANQNWRNRGSYPWQPSVVFSLPPGMKVLVGKLILTGTVSVTGGTTNGTAIGEGGPINLIKRIKITATRPAGSRYPGFNIVDCTPRSLLRYAITQHNGKFIGELAASNLGNGAAGTYQIYLSIPIFFADTTLRNVVQTALNMDLADTQGNPIYSNVQVKVDMATDLTGCFAGNDRVLNMSGCAVQWEDSRLDLPFDTTPLVQEDHDMLIAAAQTRAIDYAMPQDGAISQVMLLSEAGGAASRALSDAILNRVTIFSPTLDFDNYAMDIRQEMFDSEWYDPSQSAIGQYFIDFTNGNLGNSNAAKALSWLFDVNNPSGANLDQLKIYTRRVWSLS